MQPRDILYIVDTTNLLYQFWYSTAKDTLNEKGEPCNVLNALKTFTTNLLANENPRCLVFVFDQRLKNSLRKKLYPNYKAHRKGTPPDLERQFAWCQQWIQQQNIPLFSSAIAEADDVIATLVKLHREQFFAMTIISSDKDMFQLLEGNDVCWNLQKDIKLTAKDALKAVGVNPKQIADQLALAGDKSDNIKGIPGIGINTAAKLLKKFSNIEQIIAQRAEIKNMKFRNAHFVHDQLQQHFQLLQLNKQLTQLYDDVEGVQELKICRH